MIKAIINFLLRPLLNQRGQYSPLGVFPGPAPGTTETYEHAPFITGDRSPDYQALIARYNEMFGAGDTFTPYANQLMGQAAEMARNTAAAKGLGTRSGLTQSLQNQASTRLIPQLAWMGSEAKRGLMSNFASAVSQGRQTYAPLRTKATSVGGSGGGQAASPFQYIPSRSSGGGTGGSGGGGGGSIPQFGGGGYGGGFTNSYLGGGGSSPYIPGGMENAGYTQLGGSGTYSKPLFGGDEGTYGAFGTGGYKPGETLYATAKGGYVSQDQMQAAGGQPGLGYSSGFTYTPGANPALEDWMRKQQGGGDLSSPYTTSTGASLIGNPWEY